MFAIWRARNPVSVRPNGGNLRWPPLREAAKAREKRLNRCAEAVKMRNVGNQHLSTEVRKNHGEQIASGSPPIEGMTGGHSSRTLTHQKVHRTLVESVAEYELKQSKATKAQLDGRGTRRLDCFGNRYRKITPNTEEKGDKSARETKNGDGDI